MMHYLLTNDNLCVGRVAALLMLMLFTVLPTTSTSSGSDEAVALLIGEFCQFEIFNVSCPSNDIILMQSAVYGRQRVGRCVKSENLFMDCRADVLTFVDHRCSGRRHCKFPVADISSQQGIKPCNEYTSHLEVRYRCVQVDDIGSSSCTTLKHKTLKSQRFGYLTQSFPTERNILPLICGWILEAPAGHRIHVSLLYFSSANGVDWLLHGSATGNDVAFSCRRLARIRDRLSGKETNVCVAKDRIKDVFQSDSPAVEIVLTRRQGNSQDARFLFRFQVTGCGIPSFPGSHSVMTSETTSSVICNATNKRWSLTCVEGSWVGAMGECTESFVHASDNLGAWSTLSYEWRSAKGLTLVVSLGIVLGIAVGMLMLAIAACLIRGDHVCLPHAERCAELEMVEDAGHLVDTAETNQWICASHGGGDKELLGADLWRLNDQRSAPNPNSQVATGASSERHSSPGYHAFMPTVA